MATLRNNAWIADVCTQRLRALEALPPKTKIGVGGVLHKVSAIIAIYQAVLDDQAALVKCRAKVDAALAARRASEAKRLKVEYALKVWVLNHLGPDSPQAREFGYQAPRKGEKSAEVVATAVKLAKATREARHTMGKRQKEKIKGALAPAAPAPSAEGEALLSPPPPE